MYRGHEHRAVAHQLPFRPHHHRQVQSEEALQRTGDEQFLTLFASHPIST
jgi:hypothetical protein